MVGRCISFSTGIAFAVDEPPIYEVDAFSLLSKNPAQSRVIRKRHWVVVIRSSREGR